MQSKRNNSIGINKDITNKNRLFICATPIGNLDDVTFRLLRTLADVDFIITEDTRTLKKILSRYKIHKHPDNIMSYRDYMDEAKAASIIKNLKSGRTGALVSESGLPVIQDPGYKLVKRCIKSGIKITIVPGPNAGLSALVLSGLPPDNFIFIGFLPKKESKRAEKILEIGYLPYTIILYESAKRINNLLGELYKKIGDRDACLARELTKVYEEIIHGRISEILESIRDRRLKGEIVLIVEGYKKKLIKDYDQKKIEEEIRKLMNQNIPKKEVLKIIRSRYDIERQKLYNIATRF